jgi:hypothetical protein
MDIARRVRKVIASIGALPGRVSRRGLASAAVAIGGCLIAAGVAQVYVPAGYVIGGLLLGYAGLFLIDVGEG